MLRLPDKAISGAPQRLCRNPGSFSHVFLPFFAPSQASPGATCDFFGFAKAIRAGSGSYLPCWLFSHQTSAAPGVGVKGKDANRGAVSPYKPATMAGVNKTKSCQGCFLPTLLIRKIP